MKGPEERTIEDSEEVEETQPKEQSNDTPESPLIIEDLDIDVVAKSFNLEDKDERMSHRNRLLRIAEWARKSGAIDREGIVAKVVGARKHLGNLNIYDMSVYAGLQLDKMAIDQKLNSFEK